MFEKALCQTPNACAPLHYPQRTGGPAESSNPRAGEAVRGRARGAPGAEKAAWLPETLDKGLPTPLFLTC